MKLSKSLIYCLVFFLASPALAENIAASSKITEVTVYPDRALVNRAALLEIKSGIHEIIFSHLPVTLMDESLRVSGKGRAEVKLLSVEAKRSFLEKSPQDKVRKLEKEIEELKDGERVFLDELNTLQEKREFFSSIKLYSAEQLSKEFITREPKVEEWNGLVRFIADGYKEISERGQDINKELRELRIIIQAKEKELNEIRGAGRKEEKEIVVNIEAVKGGSFELNLAYVLHGARWLPIYDARAIEDKKIVNLSYQAMVRQATGEDWDDVNLVLSTARPAVGAKMPEIQPWYLGIQKRYDRKMFGKGGAAPTAGLMMESLDQEAERSMAVPGAQAIDVGTSVVFKIPAKNDIPSDNKLHKVTISMDTFQAKMQYVATPKLSPYAYLRAEIVNEKEFPLLSGRVNVFLEDNYIGTSSIKSISSNEKFELDLGIDEGIKVKRESIKELTETSFLGKRTRENYAYKITIENHKRTKEVITLIDQIPVSQKEEIVVKLSKDTEEPTEQDEKGILKWKIILSPGEKGEVKLGYFIEYPKDFYLPNL